MCGVVVTDGLGSVVGLDSRNLGTGGPRGLGQTGTERGPTVDQSTGRLLVLLGRLVALFGWKGCHFKGRRKEPAIEREREKEKGEETVRRGRERENGSKRQSVRLCLFVGLLTSRWISNTTPGISGAGSRGRKVLTIQAILESPKKATRGMERVEKREEKLVVKWNVGCNGLWSASGARFSVMRN